jgi:hypothetical protein
MGSGAMIYMPSFIKIGLGIQKLMVSGIHRHKTARRSRKPTLGKQATIVALWYKTFSENL